MDRALAHRLRNIVHSILIIAGMGAVAAGAVYLIWGGPGVFWAIIGVGAMLIVSTAGSKELVLSMYRTQRLTAQTAPEAMRLIEELTQRAELPRTPELHYLPSRLVNAFAIGRVGSSAVVITDGLLRILDRREVAGVLAHEVSHIANRDLWIMGLADVISRFTAFVSHVGLILLVLWPLLAMIEADRPPIGALLLLIFAPTLMSLLQLALSRAREYDAHHTAAELTGDPEGLARALAKLERRRGAYWEDILLPGRRMPEPSLLRTHPPTPERLARLQAIPPNASAARDLLVPEPVRLPAQIRVVRGAPGWRWSGVWY
ncbi:MAG: zinc metalloprotease HtpX [Pseudomonadota bacterium]